MNGNKGYAVFFFPQALEALGEAIKPYLQDSPAGAHVMCKEIDTGGALIEMSLEGMTGDGATVQLDLMVPGSMVRMIVSTQSDGDFGFGPRLPPPAATALPAAGPTAEPPQAESGAVPEGGPQAPALPQPAKTPDDGL